MINVKLNVKMCKDMLPEIREGRIYRKKWKDRIENRLI